MTMSALTDADGALRVRPSDFASYLLNPYNLTRGLVDGIAEIARRVLGGVAAAAPRRAAAHASRRRLSPCSAP